MSDAGTATPPTGTPPAWYSTLDAEHVGHVQTKGWDKLDAGAAAIELAKAHRAAEKFTGIPADQILRLPKDASDEAGWKDLWSRLGAPADAKDYDFSAVEFDEQGLNERFRTVFRDTAAKLQMPKGMAEEFAKAVHKAIGDYGESTATEQAAMAATERAKLVENWGPEDGPRFKANQFVADQAMAALNIAPEVMDKLKEGLGGAGVVELFRKIGVSMGEDKYIRDAGPGNRDVMTVEQARDRKATLIGNGRPGSGDVEWQKRYLAGGQPERREMTALNTIIAGAE